MKIDSEALDTIKELAKILDETGLTEIELGNEGQTLRVSKGGNTVISAGAAPVAAIPNMPSDPTLPQQANVDTSDNIAHSHPGAIKSPMVGTAYMQAEPGTPAFVSKGDTVQAGDTLIIIEAMKVMNPIKAEKGGTVTQILVDNGQPIEFGDVLMVIE